MDCARLIGEVEMRFPALLCSLFFIGCQHGAMSSRAEDSSKEAAKPAAMIAPEVVIDALTARSDPAPKISPAVVKGLKALGAKTSVRGASSKMRVRDLSCVMDPSRPEGPVTRCEFFDELARRQIKRSGPAAEDMRMLLSGLPVSRGDSGAATPWLECESGFGLDTCTVGALVDDEGP